MDTAFLYSWFKMHKGKISYIIGKWFIILMIVASMVLNIEFYSTVSHFWEFDKEIRQMDQAIKAGTIANKIKTIEELPTQNSNIAGRTLSESDGYFSYMGLAPGDYIARIDTAQGTKQ